MLGFLGEKLSCRFSVCRSQQKAQNQKKYLTALKTHHAYCSTNITFTEPAKREDSFNLLSFNNATASPFSSLRLFSFISSAKQATSQTFLLNVKLFLLWGIITGLHTLFCVILDSSHLQLVACCVSRRIQCCPRSAGGKMIMFQYWLHQFLPG